MTTKYGVMLPSGLIEPEWVKDSYIEASILARGMANSAMDVYLVRLTPVAVFKAVVKMEAVDQEPGQVLPFDPSDQPG